VLVDLSTHLGSLRLRMGVFRLQLTFDNTMHSLNLIRLLEEPVLVLQDEFRPVFIPRSLVIPIFAVFLMDFLVEGRGFFIDIVVGQRKYFSVGLSN